MLRRTLTGLVLLCAAGPFSTIQAQQTRPSLQPVKVVAPDRINVSTQSGVALLPVYLSADWSKPHAKATRAVIIFHGILRNADVYYASAIKARAAAGESASSMIIAPQFLTDYDAKAHGLGPDTLVWYRETWTGGTNAIAPAPVSSFTAVDAILTKLADQALFPSLTQVVIAGHSAGGQVVQRYAVVGKGESILTARGIHVRYVVANPSSYVYFTPERPGPDGRLGTFPGALTCPAYNDWKYGFAAGIPGYLDQTMDAYEVVYAARDVIYLLGANDTDPNHPELDKSCMGEAEGPYRYARGHWYFAQMQVRLGARFVHHLHDVPGVAHDNRKMFESDCGLAALFDRAGCPPN